MIVDFAYGIGEKVCYRIEAESGILSQIDRIRSLLEENFNSSQSDEGWKKERLPDEH